MTLKQKKFPGLYLREGKEDLLIPCAGGLIEPVTD